MPGPTVQALALETCERVYVLLQQTVWWQPKGSPKCVKLENLTPSHRENIRNFILVKNAETYAEQHAVGCLSLSVGQPAFDLVDWSATFDHAHDDPQEYLAATPLIKALNAELKAKMGKGFGGGPHTFEGPFVPPGEPALPHIHVNFVPDQQAIAKDVMEKIEAAKKAAQVKNTKW